MGVPLAALNIRPPEQPRSPLDTYAKAMQIKAMQQQSAMNDMQMEQARQEQQDQKTMNKALIESGGHFGKALQIATGRGISPVRLAKWQADNALTIDRLSQSDERNWKVLSEQTNLTAKAWQTVKDVPDPATRRVIYKQQRAFVQSRGIDVSRMPLEYDESLDPTIDALIGLSAETVKAAGEKRLAAAELRKTQAEATMAGQEAELTPEQRAAMKRPDNTLSEVEIAMEAAGNDPVKALKLLAELKRASRANVNLGGGGGGQELVDAIIANPFLFNQLTPTVKAHIIPQLNARGFTQFGKPLSDVAIKEIIQSDTAIKSLQDLRQTLVENEKYIGPAAGLTALNPWSPSRQAQARIDTVRQRVGRALEGGVLRKEDEEKYKKILATLRDTPETAIFKVDGLINDITRDMESYVQSQAAAGRNVQGQPGGRTAPATGTVKMRAPNGEEMDVPASKVEGYKAAGAMVVE